MTGSFLGMGFLRNFTTTTPETLRPILASIMRVAPVGSSVLRGKNFESAPKPIVAGSRFTDGKICSFKW
jgi:hypothetical protein